MIMGNAVGNRHEKITFKINYDGYDVEIDIDEEDIGELEKEFIAKWMSH